MDSEQVGNISYPGLIYRVAGYIECRLWPQIRETWRPCVFATFCLYRGIELAALIVVLWLLGALFPETIGRAWQNKRLWFWVVGFGLYSLFIMLQIFLQWLISWGLFYGRWQLLRRKNRKKALVYLQSLPEQSWQPQRQVGQAAAEFLQEYRRRQRNYQQWWLDYQQYNRELHQLAASDASAVRDWIDRFCRDFAGKPFTNSSVLQQMEKLAKRDWDTGLLLAQAKKIFALLIVSLRPYLRPPAAVARNIERLQSGFYHQLSPDSYGICLQAAREGLVHAAYWHCDWQLILTGYDRDRKDFFSLLQRNEQILLRFASGECHQFLRNQDESDYRCYERLVANHFSDAVGKEVMDQLGQRVPMYQDSPKASILMRERNGDYGWELRLDFSGFVPVCLCNARLYNALPQESGVTYGMGLQGRFARHGSDSRVCVQGLQKLRHYFLVLQRYLRRQQVVAADNYCSIIDRLDKQIGRNRLFCCPDAYNILWQMSVKYTAYAQAQFFHRLAIDQVLADLLEKLQQLLAKKLVQPQYWDHTGSNLPVRELVSDMVQICVEELLRDVLLQEEEDCIRHHSQRGSA